MRYIYGKAIAKVTGYFNVYTSKRGSRLFHRAHLKKFAESGNPLRVSFYYAVQKRVYNDRQTEDMSTLQSARGKSSVYQTAAQIEHILLMST